MILWIGVISTIALTAFILLNPYIKGKTPYKMKNPYRRKRSLLIVDDGKNDGIYEIIESEILSPFKARLLLKSGYNDKITLNTYTWELKPKNMLQALCGTDAPIWTYTPENQLLKLAPQTMKQHESEKNTTERYTRRVAADMDEYQYIAGQGERRIKQEFNNLSKSITEFHKNMPTPPAPQMVNR